jgi:lipooligosaccharide transport system permease protein
LNTPRGSSPAPLRSSADQRGGDLDERLGAVAAAPLGPIRAAAIVVRRNYIVYRQAWKLFLTGFLEPFFYLLSIGIGLGALIDTFEFNGQQVAYADFVAPGMLAASALNGALMDATFNSFFKLRYLKLYDQMLATPLTTADVARGEIAWSQLRGSAYAAAFLLIMTAMGLVHSWWAVLAFPATVLIGFASSAVCMALSTYMTSWQDFDKITLIQLPMFLFSATFFPVTAFPEPVRWVVELTPLYRGVVLCRELTTGALSWGSAVSVVYLVALGVAGLLVVRRRLDALLLK